MYSSKNPMISPIPDAAASKEMTDASKVSSASTNSLVSTVPATDGILPYRLQILTTVSDFEGFGKYRSQYCRAEGVDGSKVLLGTLCSITPVVVFFSPA